MGPEKSYSPVKTVAGVISLRAAERTNVVNSLLTYEGRTKDRSVDGTDQPKWQIIRIVKLGAETIIELANDSEEYDQIWDDRDDGIIFPVPPFANAASLLFDGSDEFIDLGDNYSFGNAQAFSWSFWFKANNFASQRCFLAKTTVDANVFGYSFQHNSSGKLFTQVRASGTLRTNTYNTTMSAATWYHIVFTYAGGSNMNGLNAYINAAVETTPGSASLNNWVVPDSLSIGRRGSGFYYSGNMNQITVWDKELSAAEVTELYNAGTPADPTLHSAVGSLKSWWPLNDSSNFPSELDNHGAIDGTLTNMEIGDYDPGDVP